MPNEVVSPNDCKTNSLPRKLLCLLLILICFIGIFNFLIIKISLTSGAVTKLVSEQWRLHQKLAWVSTICHETKQASLSNLCNINNSMPHFYTYVGGSQCCCCFFSLFPQKKEEKKRKPTRASPVWLKASLTWRSVDGFHPRRITAVRPSARLNRCSAETLHNT